MTTSESISVARGREIAQTWLSEFSSELQQQAPGALSEHFVANAYWRDILALTWDLRTFESSKVIDDELIKWSGLRNPSNFQLALTNPDVFERSQWGWTVEAFFTFETDIAVCRGHVRLLRNSAHGDRWSAWTLLTSMEELKGFEEHIGRNRPMESADHGRAAGVNSPTEIDDESAQDLRPDVLVIGAGQAGLTLAARLGQLKVPTMVVEREARVGDNWRNRYQSLVLHNQVWANHFPYVPFPSTWPVYLSKDELADWLEIYAGILSLRVLTETQVMAGSYDSVAGRWFIELRRDDGTISEISPRHLVFATGVFGVPNRIDIAGERDFSGRVLNATEYGRDVQVEGLKVLVVGSGSSAHDVAQDLCLRGASVTMLQRSSTCVVSVDPGAVRWYSIYNEDGKPVEDADLVTNSFPLPLLADLHKEMTERVAETDKELLDGLREAGFAIDFGEDGSGWLMKYHRSGGGYYINVGCSELIISGQIKIKQGTEIERLDGHSVEFADGSSMDADMVIVATGYQNMNESVRRLLGDEVAERVGPVWGLDEEGEVRGMWRRTGQPNLWLSGGSLQQCRPYSKYLALQIKGALEGIAPLGGDE